MATSTEQKIAELQEKADAALLSAYDGKGGPVLSALYAAQIFELRALRLMLREECREIMWRLSAKEDSR